MVLKKLVFFLSQLYFLSIKSSSKLGGVDSSLSERIMILKELSNSDSMSLDHIHDFGHKSINSLGAREISVNWLIGRFNTSVRLVDLIFQDGAVVQEWQVLNVSKLGSVEFDY